MSQLNLTPDELLTTTRSVRKRLNFLRPVEPVLIRECLELAVQAPTGGNRQTWHFVVVTDAQQRQALGDIYRRGFASCLQQALSDSTSVIRSLTREQRVTLKKVRDSSQYLADHMHEVPVLVLSCVNGRVEGLPNVAQAGIWGSILPAVWSFMLAARARGLGTCWTTVHLSYEQEAAEVLDIPYEKITQAALIPLAHTLGTDFKPAPRVPLDSILHWDKW
jgi:nitroreductase